MDDIFKTHNFNEEFIEAVQNLRSSSSAVLTARAEERMRQTGETDFRKAMHAELEADPELKANYLGVVRDAKI